MKKTLFILALSLLLSMMGATVLLTDDFTGTVGTNLTANGWTAHNGAGQTPMTIASPGLTYSGYSGSGIGNATSPSGTGEDVNKSFTSTNSGSVYYSFMLNTAITTTSTSSPYSIHLISSGTSFFGKFHVVLQSGVVKFGLSKTTNTPTYDSGNYAVNTTYLIVLKYTFNTGSATDDQVSMWINPNLGGSEPTANVTVTEATTDATVLTAIAIRQWNTGCLTRFDGFIVGTAWSDIAGASLAAEPTAQPTSLQFSNVTTTSLDVAFTAASPAADNYLAVRKAGSAPTSDPVDGTGYTAGGTLGDGTIAYSGNGTSFSESSLNPATTYYYKIYSYNGTGAAANYLVTSPLTGNQATQSGVVVPTVTTSTISSITAVTASGGGNVTADGGGTVSARGVCWNTTGTPDIINDSYTSNGTGTGSFTSSLTGLSENTPYYVRAYATNSAGTGYGDTVQFTTLKAEPTNHVTSFACGSETVSSITVTWTDAAKTTPDGYIIKGSDVGYSSIATPVDGVTETWSTLVHTVSQGTQSYTFTGLADNTTYYFKIYPYTNSGTDINYKTDETVPQDEGTTLENYSLDPGTIAIIGYEGDSPDWFSIVLLEDIPEGTVVYFTDNGFNDTGALNTTEGTIAWTVPAGGLTAGSVVKFTGDTWSVDQGSVTTTGSFNLATGGDQIIVYQGSSSSPSFIYAISSLPWATSGTISSNTTYLPTGLVDGETAFDFSIEYDNGYYNVIPFEGTHDELLASIADETNWILSNSVLAAPTTWDFTLEEDTNPVELASFTATISAQNYITLSWVTQTETGMQGYYIYRANSNQISTALSVSPMIAATNSSQQQSYAFTDTEVNETGTYFYWLQTNDMDGTVGFHGPVSVFFNALGDNPTPEIPLVTELHAVYPNPFNPLAFIPFSLAQDSNVSFKIYNARGQIVKHYELGNKAAGNYRITWDGTDYHGDTLSNGVYQIVMTAGSQVYQTKTTLLK